MAHDFPACDFMEGEVVYLRSVDPASMIMRIHKSIVSKVLPSRKVKERGNIVNMVVQCGTVFHSVHSNDVYKFAKDAETF